MLIHLTNTRKVLRIITFTTNLSKIQLECPKNLDSAFVSTYTFYFMKKKKKKNKKYFIIYIQV